MLSSRCLSLVDTKEYRLLTSELQDFWLSAQKNKNWDSCWLVPKSFHGSQDQFCNKEGKQHTAQQHLKIWDAFILVRFSAMLHNYCHMWLMDFSMPQHIAINNCQHDYHNNWPLLCIACGLSLDRLNTCLLFFFLYTPYSPIQINMKTLTYIFEKQQLSYKNDIFDLHSRLAVCSERLDSTLLLFLLSERGKAPLLNAPLLTSIMTVSRIEKPCSQISFSTHWWLTGLLKWILMPHIWNCSKLWGQL